MGRRVHQVVTAGSSTDWASEPFSLPPDKPCVVTVVATLAATATCALWLQTNVAASGAPGSAYSSTDWRALTSVARHTHDSGASAPAAPAAVSTSTPWTISALTASAVNTVRFEVPAGPGLLCRVAFDLGTANTSAVTILIDE